MDATTEVQGLRAELAQLRNDLAAQRDTVSGQGSTLNQWRQNGLETLTMQRAFSFGGQTPGSGRVSRNGIEVLANQGPGPNYLFVTDKLTSTPSTEVLFGGTAFGGLATAAHGQHTITTFDGSGGGTISGQLVTDATATQAYALLNANLGGKTGYGRANITSTFTDGMFEVSPQLFVKAVTADPVTQDGSIWYRSDLLKFRARNNGATVNLVTSDTTADDLTQYALLAGRSGGQTLIFGTASGNNGKIQSTSNATKGKVLFGAAGNTAYDEVNERFGIGTASPGGALEIGKNLVGDLYFYLHNDAASGTGSASSVYVYSDTSQIFFKANTSTNTTTIFGQTAGGWAQFTAGAGNGMLLGAGNNAPLVIGTNNVERMRISAAGSVVVSAAALATNATDGFLYIPTCAGAPTGAPTAFAGRVPLVFDTTGNQLWIYTGGVWKQPKVLGAATVVDWQ